MYAVKQAVIAKEHDPEIECAIFNIDIRAFGKGFEEFYQRARNEKKKSVSSGLVLPVLKPTL